MATQTVAQSVIPPSGAGAQVAGAQVSGAQSRDVPAGAVSRATDLAANGPMKPGELPKPGEVPKPGELPGGGLRTMDEGSPLQLAAPLERLPVPLIVAVPVREFRVRNLLSIAPGAVIETQWNHGEDLPIASGEVQLAWSEFEVVDTRLAVRVTRLT